MALTRRTARFAELASQTEAVLASRGMEVSIGLVDAAIDETVERVARLMGMSARTSLDHTPDTLPTTLADTLEAVDPIGRHADGSRVGQDASVRSTG